MLFRKHEMETRCFLFSIWVKVSKSRKQIMVFSILPKTQRNLYIQSIFSTQNSEFRSFYGRIEETIICFRALMDKRGGWNESWKNSGLLLHTQPLLTSEPQSRSHLKCLVALGMYSKSRDRVGKNLHLNSRYLVLLICIISGSWNSLKP